MSSPLIFMTDSYKVSHWEQFPPEMDGMYSYLESRGGEHPYTVFFGLQYILKAYLTSPVTWQDVEWMAHFCEGHGEPFNKKGWTHIVDEHGGMMPVRIKAVREGSVIPTHNVLMTVESTCPECYWIVTWLETLLLRVWYPTTVATNSYRIKQLLRSYLELSSDDPEGALPFKLHDFGARGVSSHESAMIGGAAHLVNFKGSDTIEGIRMAEGYYGTFEKMAGYSLPAAEHSTITAWGRENEREAFANMIEKFSAPGKLFSVVCDSYNLFKALEMWGTVLKEKLIASGGTLVVRPDSGDPKTIVAQCVTLLDQYFGSTINEKGYKVLNNVRVIQGDGVNRQAIHDCIEVLTTQGYSIDNIAFGMGGALIQQVNRDTQRFAYKCSSVHYKGAEHWMPISKDPVTDHGKKSKKGKLDLIHELRDDIRGGEVMEYVTISEEEQLLRGLFKDHRQNDSLLELVFENGELIRDMTFDEVRVQAEVREPVLV